MGQVIVNLAVNARDAMPKGGKLTIETANTKLEEGADCQGISVRPGRYVMLAVRDTGTGMDAETRARIFEPFFTTKSAGKGTGLGLATVYGIVEQSNGYIFVESELGKGTSFKVCLPRADETAEKTPVPEARTERLQGSETILLVEDEMALRDLIHESLRADGYRVLVATNGVEALQIVEQHQENIDLLVTDVIMPQMSGPELAQWLIARRPGIKVLYMSGYTDDKLRSISISDPQVALIQKPFPLGSLGGKVRELLTEAKPLPQSREDQQASLANQPPSKSRAK
jgi:CheY-like chemotaxis protein